MHRCLQNHDIIFLVCGSLEEITRSSKKRHFLNMALTCRAFLDPALNILWKSISNMDPIFSCLPKDLWQKVIEVDFDNNKFNSRITYLFLKRAVSPRDLERYLGFYAPRIRDLSLHSIPRKKGHKILDKDAFLALQLTTGFTPGALSPNLRSFSSCELDYQTSFLEVFPFLSLFLGKNVTSVYFDLNFLSKPLSISSMQFAVERLPKLQEISINPGFYEKDHVMQWLEDTIQNSTWSHLSMMTLGLIESPLAFKCLSTLPNLQTLKFLGTALAPSWRQDASSGSIFPDAPFFPSLRRLELSSPTVVSLDTAIYIIQHLPSTNTLQHLSVPTLNRHEASQGLQSLMDAITSRLQPAHFEELHYTADSWEEYPYPFKGPPLKPFVPASRSRNVDVAKLLPFHQLRVLNLLFSSSVFLLSSDAAPQIPSAWPKLREFRLRSGVPTRHEFVDEAGLRTILKDCPSISESMVEFLPDKEFHPSFYETDETTEED